MPRIRVAASAVIDAEPSIVYAILADYRQGHLSILPEKYLLGLEVERGGAGAGTRFRCRMRMLGQVHTFHAEVTEPDPGRVMVESIDDAQHTTTSFTVDPVNGGRRSRVAIATTWESSSMRAFVERLIAPRMLRRIYAEELRNLARVAAEQAGTGAPNVQTEARGGRRAPERQRVN